MRRATILAKKFAILCHRWMGVAFCILFTWWFISGIFMMYWDYPRVVPADRLEHSDPINASKIQLSPAEAWERLGQDHAPDGVSVAMLDGRPAYRFAPGAGAGRAGRGRAGGDRRGGGGSPTIVYADDGSRQESYSDAQLLRVAAIWTGRPAAEARIEEVTKSDQWTIAIRQRLPLRKYSFPDGQQVYVAVATGEVLQYTTTASRLFAHLGAIPHWLYYTPLRVQQRLWTNVVIYASLLATVTALMGLIVGIWMYSPSQRYRVEGAPVSVPYSGLKRLHMILGLFFGMVTCTWAFSGMLSMDPPFLTTRGGVRRGGNPSIPAARIQAAFETTERFDLSGYAAKPVQAALAQLGDARAKEVEFSSFDGQPVYIAKLDSHLSEIVPVHGEPRKEFDRDRVLQMVQAAAQPGDIAETRVLTKYDAYYLDRHRKLPLPVLFVKLNDPARTQLYIDYRSGRVAAQHSDNSSFMTRWLYHGLHSLDFPWLYNHRPAWDIVVLALMGGGLWLCITSIIIGWRLLMRTLIPQRAANRPEEGMVLGD